MKKIAFILFVPLIGFMVFSQDFYSLWLNGKSGSEIALITILSNIIVFECFFNAVTFPLAQISLVVNKMHVPVMVSFIIGVSNTMIVFLLLKFTDIGVYAIASVSTILLVVRYLFFNPWYVGHVLDINPLVFYKASYKIYCTIPILMMLIFLIKKFFIINSWIKLGIAAFVCGAFGYLIMYILLYGKLLKIMQRSK